MPIPKKYLTPNTQFPHPHIGKMLLAVLKKQGKNKTDLAKMLGVTQTTTTQYFKNASIQFSILWNIGVALNYDFLAELCNNNPPSMPRNEKSILVQENLDLKAQLLELEKKCTYYKEILMK